MVFPANDADPMSRNKNVFTSVDRHLYLASVTYMAGKDKKKFRSHERQKISPRRYSAYCFLFVKHLSSGSPRIGLNHLSFDQMCYQVALLPPKNILQNKIPNAFRQQQQQCYFLYRIQA